MTEISRAAGETTAAPEERTYLAELLGRVAATFPERKAGSAEERGAQEAFGDELRGCGLELEWLPFLSDTHLYAVLSIHFGIATLGTLLTPFYPAVALTLHLLSGISYWLDSTTRRVFILRRLLPWLPSQNLLARRSSKTGRPRLRLVLLGHADAAYTGWMFQPALLRRLSHAPLPRWLRFLQRSVLLSEVAIAGLAALDVLLLVGARVPLPGLFAALLGLAPALGFLLNLQVVVRNELVVGANDNLSACVALPVLARRLEGTLPEDVELVYGVTGCEEAGTRGSAALADDLRERWGREETVIIALDGLSNGELVVYQEGELIAVPTPPWLRRAAEAAIASDARFSRTSFFRIPSGATDLLPFAVRGYEGLSLGCIDPEIGAARHYHLPGDTPQNLDLDQLLRSIDFTEELVREIVRRSALRATANA